jgi:hypothetical protein
MNKKDVFDIRLNLPECEGEWLSGSGGHRTHGPCDYYATWLMRGGWGAYCDKHIVEWEKEYYVRVSLG